MVQTRIYQSDEIPLAAQQLKEGKLIAFPTETVFGLGAIANNETAVKAVFHAKGRPSDNPLIVHVASKENIDQYVAGIHPVEAKLMEAFWPGPLTIIFPVKPGVFAKAVTSGQKNVGIRMPNHSLTLSLIQATGFPLVGPSANTSGKPSPTQVSHVLHDLNGKIAGVLDPQETLPDIGVESTVVRYYDERIDVLRPGAITKQQIQAVTGIETVEISAKDQVKSPELMSPGVKYRHYSPNQPVYLIDSTINPIDWPSHLQDFNQKIAILADDMVLNLLKKTDLSQQITAVYSLGSSGDFVSATQRLFAGLRQLEDSDAQVIIAQGLPNIPETNAFMNRLTKTVTNVL